jgi:hypothetical protein
MVLRRRMVSDQLGFTQWSKQSQRFISLTGLQSRVGLVQGRDK